MIIKKTALTDPKALVARELKNAGFDINALEIPERVYLLADSLFDVMLAKNVGNYKYPLGGDLFVFNDDPSIGFIKGAMCSPAIATQAEDLIAGGVRELIHIGFAGGLNRDIKIGDVILTDGAYNDTAVARLYGYDRDFIESDEFLTNAMFDLFSSCKVNLKRGKHWTTDAGYMETYEQVSYYNNKGALCVEMEGVGLFTVAHYRKVEASAIYVISDILTKDGWSLGSGEKAVDTAVNEVTEAVLFSVKNRNPV